MSLPRRGFLGFLASIPAAIMAPAKLFGSTPEAPKGPRPLLCKDIEGWLIDNSAPVVIQPRMPEVQYMNTGPYVTYTSNSATNNTIYCYSLNTHTFSGMLYIKPDDGVIGFEYKGKWGTARYETDLKFFEGSQFKGVRMIVDPEGEARPVRFNIARHERAFSITVMNDKGIDEAYVYITRADVEALIQQYRNRY